MEATVEKKPRTAWIDIARGICIILVVAMHFDEMHFANIGGPPLALEAWDYLTSAMRPARMPAFFMISGMLAVSTIQAGSNAKLIKRISLLGYLYILWAAIYLTVFYYFLTPMTADYVIELALRIPKQVIWPSNQIWYLYALILFLLVARLARNHAYKVMIASVAIYAAHLQIENQVASQMARCAVFFFTGAFFPELIGRLVKGTKPSHLAPVGIAYAALVAPRLIFPDITVWLRLPASMVGVFLVFQVARMLVNFRLNRVIIYVGRNTLPIYVLHSSFLLALTYVATTLKWNQEFMVFPTFAWVYPVVGISLLIGLCLAIGAAIRSVNIEGVLTLPTMRHSREMTASAS